jgi:hypothetical protein
VFEENLQCYLNGQPLPNLIGLKSLKSGG